MSHRGYSDFILRTHRLLSGRKTLRECVSNTSVHLRWYDWIEKGKTEGARERERALKRVKKKNQETLSELRWDEDAPHWDDCFALNTKGASLQTFRVVCKHRLGPDADIHDSLKQAPREELASIPWLINQRWAAMIKSSSQGERWRGYWEERRTLEGEIIVKVWGGVRIARTSALKGEVLWREERKRFKHESWDYLKEHFSEVDDDIL